MASNTLVAACIPYYRCATHVCRAVESLLSQTHQHVLVMVINDGDPNPPWPYLSHIRDPRLVRFNLPSNRGPYFAMAVALNATKAPFFLMQDADDWSASTRVKELLSRIEADHSDLAVSAQPQFSENAGNIHVTDVRWAYTYAQRPRTRFTVKTSLTPTYEYRVPHAGLFRSQSLRDVGGYYGGVRVGTDLLVTNLLLMTGKISHVPLPLYYRLVRPQSLTHSSHTGLKSEYDKRVRHHCAYVYNSCYKYYTNFREGLITRPQLKKLIRQFRTRLLLPTEIQQLLWHASCLRSLLSRASPQEKIYA